MTFYDLNKGECARDWFNSLSREDREGWVFDTRDEGPNPTWELLSESTKKIILDNRST